MAVSDEDSILSTVRSPDREKSSQTGNYIQYLWDVTEVAVQISKRMSCQQTVLETLIIQV